MKPELEPIVQHYLDGSISPEEARRLNEELATDQEARRRFTEWLNLDSALAEAAAGWSLPAEKVPQKPRFTRFHFGIAAAAVLVIFLTVLPWRSHSPATVVSIAGVPEWTMGLKIGTKEYHIDEGSIELQTREGARIAIEAPAVFRFPSSMRMEVTRGRVAADVPPAAKGFTLVTPRGEAIDLGTRFGVDVVEGGDSEIHVFEGEVIAKNRHDEGGKSLRQGDAIALRTETSAIRNLRSSAFIHPDEVPGLTAGLAAGQRGRAGDRVDKLRLDPSLIALLDFEKQIPHQGNFRVVQGRWPGSKAPEFVEENDHLKLDAGADREWPLLTLAAWVRLDKLGAPYQSLLHTDDWDENKKGQVHWMVTRHMTMRLALRGNTLADTAEESEGYPDSRTSVLPEQGRWVHLAAVYDSTAKTVRFYLNGRFDKQTLLETAHPARLGPAQIGNWNRNDRRLSGRVDELLLLGRAMSDQEIRELFEAGNPYHNHQL
ncbi:MAG: FecR domain-containing protein [Verrucomicrobiales bacterium]|nr:FecR domain-containing protein [Verrucomicrobiales bacterium]